MQPSGGALADLMRLARATNPCPAGAARFQIVEDYEFPSYGANEVLADKVVHGLGLGGAVAALAWLIGRLPESVSTEHVAAVFVYGTGLLGSYTPFVLLAMRPSLGVPICAFVWAVAIVGTIIKLTSWADRNILSLALYLGMGWLVLGFLRPLAAALSSGALLCLVLGGLVYSLGAAIFCLPNVRFHNVVWHAFVIVAAGLHLSAVAQILPSR